MLDEYNLKLWYLHIYIPDDRKVKITELEWSDIRDYFHETLHVGSKSYFMGEHI